MSHDSREILVTAAPDPIRLEVFLDRAALERAIAEYLRIPARHSGWSSDHPIRDAIDAACRDVSRQFREAVTRAITAVVGDPGFVPAIESAYREATLERVRQRARAAVDRMAGSLFAPASGEDKA